MTRILTALFALLLFSAEVCAFSIPTVLSSVRPIMGMRMDPESGNFTLRPICTATSINQQSHYWLTAAHCTDENVYIDTERAEVVFADARTDLAVLRTPNVSARALRLSSRHPVMGTPVHMIGHPVGHVSPNYFSGIVSNPRGDDNYMWFSLTACGGNSGSAIVNDQDEIVSVLQVGYGRPCSGFSGGARFDVLRNQVGRFFRR